MLDSVEFSVDGFPPAYDSALSISNKNHRRYHFVAKLQECAKDALNGSDLIQGDLKMELKCEATLDHVEQTPLTC